jgi:hypothetical protein
MSDGVGVTRSRTMLTPRTRGSVTGLGLVLLGAWGAIIPFVGPYFHYAYTPDATWIWTAARFFLEVLPGGVAFFAGVVLLGSANRVSATLAGWLGVLAGAWFVVGPLLAPIWQAGYVGTPVGGTTRVSVEQIGIFYGLGAAIILLAAFALGRFSVVGVRDVAYAKRRAASREAALAPEGETYPAATPSATTSSRAVPEAPVASAADDADDVPRGNSRRGLGWRHAAHSK